MMNAPFQPSVNRIPIDRDFCIRNCGCFQPGYPGGSGFNVTIGGRVFGVNNRPATNFPMNSSVNGRTGSLRTNNAGRYQLTAQAGSDITVAPQTQPGVMAMPSAYNFINQQADSLNNDFQLRSLTPGR